MPTIVASAACPFFVRPWDLRTVKHILYRNNGDHTFTDVTDRAGVGRPTATALELSPPILMATARIDLYVANDMNPNFTFPEQGRRNIP